MWSFTKKTIFRNGGGAVKTEVRPMTKAEEQRFDRAMKRLDEAMMKLEEAFSDFSDVRD